MNPRGKQAVFGLFRPLLPALGGITVALPMTPDPDRPDQDEPPPPGVILIKVFASATEAEAAAALLDANGISCWLQADDCGGMLSALDSAQGVKLLVNPADAEAVKALLAAMPDAAAFEAMVHSGPASGDTPPPKSEVPIVSLLQIGGGVAAGILLCLFYQWASQLGVKTYRYDTDGDGRRDVTWVYRDGQCIEMAEDRNSDGILDCWVYYKDGYRYESATADDNFDGQLDGWSNYTNGILVSARIDTDFNGIPDATSYFQHGQIIRCDWQPNGTNIITLREVFRNAQLIEEQRDTNWDGSFDVIVRYDAYQNPVATNLPARR